MFQDRLIMSVRINSDKRSVCRFGKLNARNINNIVYKSYSKDLSARWCSKPCPWSESVEVFRFVADYLHLALAKSENKQHNDRSHECDAYLRSENTLISFSILFTAKVAGASEQRWYTDFSERQSQLEQIEVYQVLFSWETSGRWRSLRSWWIVVLIEPRLRDLCPKWSLFLED